MENNKPDRSENTDKVFKKIKRAAALTGAILLLGIYATAIVAAAGKWENSHAVFMTAIYLSIAVPVIIYLIMVIHRLFTRNKSEEKNK